MFIVLKKKTVIIAVIVVAVLVVFALCGSYFINREKTASFGQKVIVVDAGHGGRDYGVTSPSGITESEKNLEVANMLKEKLEDGGFFVVMTRTDESGAETTWGFKSEDFEKRKQIIEKYDPDLVISVHCNKYPSAERRGAQVFYNALSESGKNYACIVQESINGLNSTYVGRAFSALQGEYYMLNCTLAPSIIVECGFLSNPDDEKLLTDESYLEKLVYAIYDGTVAYLENQ